LLDSKNPLLTPISLRFSRRNEENIFGSTSRMKNNSSKVEKVKINFLKKGPTKNFKTFGK